MSVSDSIMFGVCLWYKVFTNSNLQVLIDRLRNTFQSLPLQAHITVKANSFNIDDDYGYFNSIPKPYFVFGPMRQTVTLGSNGTRFYALQRDLYLNGSTGQISTYHMSFAYRYSKFTDEELEYANRETAFFDRIDPQEFELQVWQCQNYDTRAWQRLK